jgi:hypothetical protein
MITLTIIIFIWFIVSSYKVLRDVENFLNPIYGSGVVSAIFTILFFIGKLIIRYLP